MASNFHGNLPTPNVVGTSNGPYPDSCQLFPQGLRPFPLRAPRLVHRAQAPPSYRHRPLVPSRPPPPPPPRPPSPAVADPLIRAPSRGGRISIKLDFVATRLNYTAPSGCHSAVWRITYATPLCNQRSMVLNAM